MRFLAPAEREHVETYTERCRGWTGYWLDQIEKAHPEDIGFTCEHAARAFLLMGMPVERVLAQYHPSGGRQIFVVTCEPKGWG